MSTNSLKHQKKEKKNGIFSRSRACLKFTVTLATDILIFVVCKLKYVYFKSYGAHSFNCI